MLNKIQEAIVQITRRADQPEQRILNAAFVNTGNLLSNLSSSDHQIIFGRRGTGKTHILRYFKDEKIAKSDIAIYIDMRNIGSDTSIYNNRNIDIADRAKRLLLDVFNAIVNELLDISFKTETIDDKMFSKFDILQDQISSIKVIAKKNIEESTASSNDSKSMISLGVDGNGPKFSIDSDHNSSDSLQKKVSYTEKEEIAVVFSGIAPAFNSIADSIQSKRIWILLDEWASIPSELQPILSDLIRRTLLTCRKISVKIAAIEIGSIFIEKHGETDYLGIELGADIQADISLDDFMVFGNDGSRAEHFFAELFRKHIMAIDNSLQFANNETFVSACFTQRPAFVELIRASEGVPRDAINILRLATTRNSGEKYTIASIRNAARLWYERDKSSNISEKGKILLQWIIDNVIKGKKARGFLLDQEQYKKRNDISSLINDRVLHIIKRGISAKENPGARYDVYSIDYGCYVELLTTSLAPQPLDINFGNNEEVPYDDYRSLRRAILSLEEFDRYLLSTNRHYETSN